MSEKTNNINTKLRQITDSEAKEVIGGRTNSSPYVSRILTDDEIDLSLPCLSDNSNKTKEDDYKEDLALSLKGLEYQSEKITDFKDGIAKHKIEI